jgi:hypothetical protein
MDGTKDLSSLSDPTASFLNHPPSELATVLGYLLPYTIAYLVHVPNTRLIRIGLYPLGLLVTAWCVLTYRGDPGELVRYARAHTDQVGFSDGSPAYERYSGSFIFSLG